MCIRDREDLKRIAAVRRLPLDGLSVAALLTLIRTGATGYLMPLASDMKPIREPYLPREFGARETNAAWYRRTGGLRRRLAIAAIWRAASLRFTSADSRTSISIPAMSWSRMT